MAKIPSEAQWTSLATTLNGKQDKLTAGTNITLAGNTISATDTKYTAGDGLTLAGTKFSVNTETVVQKSDIADMETKANAEATYAKKTDIASAYIYKGTKATKTELDELTEGNTTGDVYNVEDTGMNYAWNGEAWDALGSTVDLSNYQLKLTAGTGITITGQTIAADIATLATQLSTAETGSLATKDDLSKYALKTEIPGVATTEKAGTVKPDGTTITVTEDGTIAAKQQDLSTYATKEYVTQQLEGFEAVSEYTDDEWKAFGFTMAAA